MSAVSTLLPAFIDIADEELFHDFDNFKQKSLVAKKVHEKRYDNANDNHEIFQYEFKCFIEDANESQEAVFMSQERSNPDRAVFLNFARLGFQGNELLGFKTNSLHIKRRQDVQGVERMDINDQTREEFNNKTNHLTLSIDAAENAIHFEFNFQGETDDIEITFKVLMRKRLEFNLTDLFCFRIEESAYQYHENGILHGDPDISNREHFGYNRNAIMHLHRDEFDLRNLDDAELMIDMPEHIGDQIENLRGPWA